MTLILFRNLVAVLFAVCALRVAASPEDSLEQLARRQQGSARADTWIQLAGRLQGKDDTRAKAYARQALKWSEANKYPKGVFLGNLQLAYILSHSGYLNEAGPHLNKALEAAAAAGDSVWLARAWNLKSDFLYEEGNFNGALGLNRKSLQIFETRHDTDNICNTLNRMALAYGGLSRDAEETAIHHQLLDIAVLRNDQAGLSATANNLAAVHYRHGDYDEAGVYFAKGLEAARKAGHIYFESAALHGLGNVAYRKARYDEALQRYRESAAINTRHNFIGSLGLNYMQMAGVYAETGDWAASVRYNTNAGEVFLANGMIERYAATVMYKADGLIRLKKFSEALPVATGFHHLADSLHELEYLTNASRQLYECYKGLGNYQKSTEWLEAFVEWSDSLAAMEKQDLVRELESKHQLKEMKSANNALQTVNTQQESELDRQQFTISTMLVIGSLVLVIAALLLVGFTRLRKANALLARQKEQIEEQAESLRELNATKDKFFSIIAHDLKNPFGGLMTLSALMAEDFDTLSQDELRNMVHLLRDSSKGGYALLENLLEWSRSQTGIIELNTSVLNLAELTRSELEKQELTAHGKNISLQMDIPAHLQTKADENMYRLIIRNLVSNAIKFTPAGGQITVSAVSKHGLLEVSVNDTGIGMDDQTKLKLFRQDVKLTTRGTANEKGTGLGLLLCKEFVEKQQGKIWVESTPGKGSSFRFSLPVL